MDTHERLYLITDVLYTNHVPQAEEANTLAFCKV